MTIDQLRKDMIAAAKAQDKPRKEVLSALVGAVMKLAIDEGTRDSISEELVSRAITKEQYTYRYNVISEYAPKMMSADEIRAFLEQNCSEVLATKNKGQIMKTVMPLLKGKADGKTISSVVAELTK